MLVLYITSLIIVLFTEAFRVVQLEDTKYVEIEAVHSIDTPLGIQVVHAVVALSKVEFGVALRSESVWYIPEQVEFPKLVYLTSYGWFLLDEPDYSKIRKRAYPKKAPRNAQLDVTSLVRLAPSSLDGNVQFIKKGSIGAYVYSGTEEQSIFRKTVEDAQLIRNGNLGAYIYSDASQDEPNSESLFWVIPAIGSRRVFTTRLHDSSLLLYYGMPKLVRMSV